MIFNMQEFDNGGAINDSFQAHDATIERWLKDEVAPAYDAYKVGTNKTSSLADARKRVETFINGVTILKPELAADC